MQATRTLFAIGAFCFAAAVQAQNYPSGPLRIIIPFSPGGSTDSLGRIIAQRLNEKFKVPAVFAANPIMYKNLPYDQTRDLAPVSQLVAGPLTLTVHPSLPAKTARDLISLAKTRPGEITFGSSGTGSLNQLAAEWFALSAGVKMIHVPYRGGGSGVIDLMSGQISLYFMNALQSLPYIKR